MIRTQVQLDEDQYRALKHLAAQRGVSMATLLREGVDRILDDEGRQRDWELALSVVGRYRGGRDDVALNHDRYLDEA